MVAKKLSEQWKVLDPQRKAKYDRGAVKDKERYMKVRCFFVIYSIIALQVLWHEMKQEKSYHFLVHSAVCGIFVLS